MEEWNVGEGEERRSNHDFFGISKGFSLHGVADATLVPFSSFEFWHANEIPPEEVSLPPFKSP